MPQQLLALIQAQLDPNCPGAARAFEIQAAAATIYIGRQNLAGALSPSNYGYELVAGANKSYGSSFPGSNAPVGDLQVYMAAAGTFNVEVLA